MLLLALDPSADILTAPTTESSGNESPLARDLWAACPPERGEEVVQERLRSYQERLQHVAVCWQQNQYVSRHRLGQGMNILWRVEIRRIRDEEGRSVEAGERAEIYVRGEQVSGEYEGTGSVIDNDGWFPTRDAGFLDSEGYLFLDGRADDIIVRGGENMSPGEIEDVLINHPAVADAAVAGIPSEQWGEAVIAAVVLKGEVTVEDLQGWVKEHLRSSRVPERIEFWDELPYTETGKLLRRLVKAKFL